MKYIYYDCNGKRNQNYKCDNGSVKRDWIEDIVVQATKEFVKRFNATYFEDIQSEYIKEVENCNHKEIKTLQDKLNSVESEIQRLVDAISKASLESLISRLELLEQQKKEFQKIVEASGIQFGNEKA